MWRRRPRSVAGLAAIGYGFARTSRNTSRKPRMRHAILIAGHGSRDAEGIAEFLALARHFRTRWPDVPLEIAFLEFARPTIQEAIDRLAQADVDTIVVLPGVLMAAGHAKNDMASEVRLARERHPHIDFRMGSA